MKAVGTFSQIGIRCSCCFLVRVLRHADQPEVPISTLDKVRLTPPRDGALKHPRVVFPIAPVIPLTSTIDRSGRISRVLLLKLGRLCQPMSPVKRILDLAFLGTVYKTTSRLRLPESSRGRTIGTTASARRSDTAASVSQMCDLPSLVDKRCLGRLRLGMV